MILILGGFRRNSNVNNKSRFPVIESPSESDLLSMLDELRDNSGMLRLRVSPEPDVGVSSLTLNSNGIRYLIMLLEYKEDGESHVRSPNNLSCKNVLVEFEGEMYPSKSIIEDFEHVKSIFTDFLAHGDSAQLS